MNNESGSALQKANFVLLIIVAGALGYLIVREHIRTEQRAAEAETTAANAAAAPAHSLTQRPAWNPAEMKSSFAPLRPRVETNVLVRVVTNRVPIVVRTNFPLVASRETQATELSAVPPLSSPDAPVPVAFTRGVAGERAGSSVSGRVTLRGTPPPEKVIALDAACGRLRPAPLITRHFVVGADGGLANTFVYVKSGVAPQKTAQPNIPLLDNVNCEFQPYLLGVRAGQPFQIRNSDQVLHNVHSLPKKAGNREFNVGLPIAGMTVQKSFDKPEVLIELKCDVHPWMFAYLGVVDHPWFAVTDGDGNFALPAGLSPGRYTLGAVHVKAGETTRQITITEESSEPVNFTLDVPHNLAKTP